MVDVFYSFNYKTVGGGGRRAMNEGDGSIVDCYYKGLIDE
jgi:hypothetical protein